MKKNPHAAALGRLSKGKKKTLTTEERAARAKRMAKARLSRWPKD
jgi:hypothetical protein